MADQNQRIADALAALTAILTTMSAPRSSPVVLDPFSSGQPFNLSNRADAAAYQILCAALDVKWDGDVKKFPPFLITLKIKAKDMHWDDPTTGITIVACKNIFDAYDNISDAEVAAAKVARTDD